MKEQFQSPFNFIQIPGHAEPAEEAEELDIDLGEGEGSKEPATIPMFLGCTPVPGVEGL